jgi:hypothetical protein
MRLTVAERCLVHQSESVLGNALRGIDRSRYILSTKVGRYGMSDFDFSAARVTKSIDERYAYLRTDRRYSVCRVRGPNVLCVVVVQHGALGRQLH